MGEGRPGRSVHCLATVNTDQTVCFPLDEVYEQPLSYAMSHLMEFLPETLPHGEPKEPFCHAKCLRMHRLNRLLTLRLAS